MRLRSIIRLTVSLASGLVMGLVSSANADVCSTFDSDRDGWVEALDTGGSVSDAAHSWSGSGGNPGGYYSFDEALAGPDEASYMLAPPDFLGDLSHLIDCGQLCYDHVIFDSGGWDRIATEILLESGNTRWRWSAGETCSESSHGPCSRAVCPSFAEDWSTTCAVLREEDWDCIGGCTTWPATLANVTSIRILIERVSNPRASQLGCQADPDPDIDPTDIEGVDNVCLVDCSPDCCDPCELAHLLTPLLPGARGVASTDPCFGAALPTPPTDACCAAIDSLLPSLPGSPDLPGSHPCVVPTPPDRLSADANGDGWRTRSLDRRR